MLARVWRAAKPITRPSTALEARMPVARRENWVNLLSASAAPIARMITKISLRTRRRRVCADRESVVSPETFDATRLARDHEAVDGERDCDRDAHRDESGDQVLLAVGEEQHVRRFALVRVGSCVKTAASRAGPSRPSAPPGRRKAIRYAYGVMDCRSIP